MRAYKIWITNVSRRLVPRSHLCTDIHHSKARNTPSSKFNKFKTRQRFGLILRKLHFTIFEHGTYGAERTLLEDGGENHDSPNGQYSAEK